MKSILKYILIGTVALGVTSCKKYLDVNNNPNSPTTTTPENVLPQAIVGTASLVNNYNSNFSYPGGFFANIYGVGGYGATVSYNYTPVNFTGLWSSSYDNAEDYQFIINNTAADPTLVYSNSIARIMKAFVFSKLVDEYNDVPYTDALKGEASLAPKYDKAVDIYKDLVAQLNASIAAITKAQAAPSTDGIVKINSSADPMFGSTGGSQMDNWKRFANTLKLRLLIKMAGVSDLNAYAKTEFTNFDNALGIMTDDALVNPGYVKQAGRIAPIYGFLASNENNQRSQGQAIPTTWIYSFYNGGKITDSGRGSVIYRGFPSTATNQLGQQDVGSGVVPPANFTSWFTGADYNASALGAAKGPTQGQPVMLLAEARLLKAEAIVRGYLSSGSAQTDFEAGVAASFRYLLKTESGAVTADGTQALATYKNNNVYRRSDDTVNPLSYLVNWDDTAVPHDGDYNTNVTERQIEAIITQKYIAMNVINCDEAYAEYRRTKYPRVINGSLAPTASFASRQSTSTSPDKLITRIPYPQSEYNLNPSNAPKNIDIFKTKIFWDVKN